MFLQEVFDTIMDLDSYQLIIDGVDNDQLDAAGHPKLIRAINLGLTELHSEFQLKENSVTVQLYDQLTDYVLHSDYAVTNDGSSEPIKYIVDSQFKPFQDDVIKIEKVFNEESFELPINDERYDYSVYTPDFQTLQHPYPNSNNAVFVHYKAKHVEIATTADPATTEVVIPRTLLNLLSVWVTSKLLTTINQQEAQQKLAEYNTLLFGIKNQPRLRTDETANEKLDIRGWE